MGEGGEMMGLGLLYLKSRKMKKPTKAMKKGKCQETKKEKEENVLKHFMPLNFKKIKSRLRACELTHEKKVLLWKANDN